MQFEMFFDTVSNKAFLEIVAVYFNLREYLRFVVVNRIGLLRIVIKIQGFF
jgi:hypothetical protein